MTPESWQLDLIGGGLLTDPDGNETLCALRMVWMMTAEHTLRFLIYLSGEDVPIVRVVCPTTRNAIARAAIEAFEQLTESLPIV
jgi:hypothetical protein